MDTQSETQIEKKATYGDIKKPSTEVNADESLRKIETEMERGNTSKHTRHKWKVRIKPVRRKSFCSLIYPSTPW